MGVVRLSLGVVWASLDAVGGHWAPLVGGRVVAVVEVVAVVDVVAMVDVVAVVDVVVAVGIRRPALDWPSWALTMGRMW